MFPFSTYAESDDMAMEFEEFHDQINFEFLSYSITNKNNLSIKTDPTTPFLKRNEAKKQIEKYYSFIENHPNEEKNLIKYILSGNCVCAISYTDAPVILVDDHFERIEKEKSVALSPLQIVANASQSKETDSPSIHTKFTLKTIISKTGLSNPYYYLAITEGTWDNTAFARPKNRPATGNDYVLQTCPIVTTEPLFTSEYNYSTNGSIYGQNGINFFVSDGGDCWAKIDVVDNPFGLAQLKQFDLLQGFYAKSNSDTKKINSYYIHTWKAMSIGVSQSRTAGFSGESPYGEVTLNITPSVQDKQWQLYNCVSYNF